MLIYRENMSLESVGKNHKMMIALFVANPHFFRPLTTQQLSVLEIPSTVSDLKTLYGELFDPNDTFQAIL